MGKSKSKKHSKATLKQNLSNNVTATATAPILKKLQFQECELSAGVEEETIFNDKIWALTCVSNLVFEQENLNSLLDAQVLEILLLDLSIYLKRYESDLLVRPQAFAFILECLGALRNIIMSGSSSTCLKCLQLGALPTLLQFLPKVINGVKSSLDTNNQIDPCYDFLMMAEQVLSCLWTFSENNHDAVVQLTNIDTLSFLIALMNSKNVKQSLQCVAGQFLNTLGEDNSNLLLILQQNPALKKTLVDIVMNNIDNPGELELITASILFNINEILDGDIQENLTKTIIEIIFKAVNIDLNGISEKAVQEAIELEKQVQSSAEEQEKLKNLELVSPQNKSTDYLKSANDTLISVQFALELATNLFSENDGANQGQEDEEELVDDFEMEQDLIEEQDEQSVSLLAPELLGAIFKLAMSNCVDLQVTAARAFASNVEQVKIRALACINNLFLIGAVKPLLQNEQIVQETRMVWSSLFDSLLFHSAQSPVPLELVEAIVTALWSICRVLIIIPTKHQVSWFCQAGAHSDSTPEDLQVKAIGILARLAQQDNLEINKIIGDFMLNQLRIVADIPGLKSVLYMCELLNSIYDVYGDGDYSYDLPVFVSSNYLKSLEALSLKIATKVKAVDRRTQRFVRDRGDETVLNLSSFIAYKKQERSTAAALR